MQQHNDWPVYNRLHTGRCDREDREDRVAMLGAVYTGVGGMKISHINTQ